MLVKSKCVLTDVTEVTSKKGRVYLNGKLRSSKYDFNYLMVGVRLDASLLDNEPHDYVLDVGQSWIDNSNGSKDCRTHISVVGIE